MRGTLARRRLPRVWVIKIWPPWRRDRVGITFPPFGVVVRNDWWIAASLPKRRRLLRHEQCHWIQYQRMGVIRFYWDYLLGTIRHGYRNHPMEIEARQYANRF